MRCVFGGVTVTSLSPFLEFDSLFRITLYNEYFKKNDVHCLLKRTPRFKKVLGEKDQRKPSSGPLFASGPLCCFRFRTLPLPPFAPVLWSEVKAFGIYAQVPLLHCSLMSIHNVLWQSQNVLTLHSRNQSQHTLLNQCRQVLNETTLQLCSHVNSQFTASPQPQGSRCTCAFKTVLRLHSVPLNRGQTGGAAAVWPSPPVITGMCVKMKVQHSLLYCIQDCME